MMHVDRNMLLHYFYFKLVPLRFGIQSSDVVKYD